jgi:CRISPR-associated protein Csx14
MRNILLAVVGLSPQVVTETLFALHQQGRAVHSIHLVTTREGMEKIFATLLSGENGPYRRYLAEYGIDPASIEFNETTVHVVRDSDGREIPDITDSTDNERLLELCLRLVFQFTIEPENALFLSVAGGRKTMSSCLALAAQLYGRRQDRMVHVLVSPEFESCRDFFYPPKEPRLIELKGADGHPFYKDTRYARVTLVPFPFVSLRGWLSPEYLEKPHDPATLLASLVRDEKPALEVDLPEGKVRWQGMEMDLPPAQMALYALFALAKKECQKDGSCRDCADCHIDYEEIKRRQTALTGLYLGVRGTRPMEEMSDTGIISLSLQNFNTYEVIAK